MFIFILLSKKLQTAVRSKIFLDGAPLINFVRLVKYMLDNVFAQISVHKHDLSKIDVPRSYVTQKY